MRKLKDILYSTASNSIGELITIEKAVKGTSYSCPICQGDMIPRLGKNKRHHFAHKALTEDCTPESVLHYSFKMVLAQKIEEHIRSQQPLQISWGCSCYERHTGNLVKKAKRVEVEYNLGICRPDIALLDSSDRAIAAIEVVVTHEPEERVLDYYKKQGIGAVIFRLDSEADLNRIGSSMTPDQVYSCLNPRCNRCGNRSNRKDLAIIQSRCKWCQHPMLVAAILSKGAMCGEFCPSDLKMARSKGVHIGYWQSKKSGWFYPTSACPNCRGVVGLSWLWDDHANPNLGLSRELIPAGHVCMGCNIDLQGNRQVRSRTKPSEIFNG